VTATTCHPLAGVELNKLLSPHPPTFHFCTVPCCDFKITWICTYRMRNILKQRKTQKSPTFFHDKFMWHYPPTSQISRRVISCDVTTRGYAPLFCWSLTDLMGERCPARPPRAAESDLSARPRDTNVRRMRVFVYASAYVDLIVTPTQGQAGHNGSSDRIEVWRRPQ
jgi:hypothetical protein